MPIDPLWPFLGLFLLVQFASFHARIGAFWMILLALPSTLLHELSHALGATLTGGKVVSFSVFPRSQIVETLAGPRKVWALGGVEARVGMLSAVPCALAPLIFLFLAYRLFLRWPEWFPVTGGGVVAAYLCIYVLIRASIPSRPDWLILAAHPRSTVFYGVAGALGWLFREEVLEVWGRAINSLHKTCL